jgi:hypothetical protein
MSVAAPSAADLAARQSKFDRVVASLDSETIDPAFNALLEHAKVISCTPADEGQSHEAIVSFLPPPDSQSMASRTRSATAAGTAEQGATGKSPTKFRIVWWQGCGRLL